MTHIPPAALGTLWVAPTQATVALDELLATQIPAGQITDTRAVASLPDLLRANLGRRVLLTLDNGKDMSGVLRAFGPNPAAAPLYLETSEGTGKTYLVFREQDVKQVVFYDLPASKLEVLRLPEGSSQGKQPVLCFHAKGVNGPVGLSMGYLRNGFGWTPAYRIVLEDDKTASITLQAVVINDAEDLEDAEVFFVVGFPNFTFARILSPLSLQQSLAGFLSSLTSRQMGENENVMSNAITMQRPAGYRPRPDTDVDDELGRTIEGAAQSEEDLFLYGRQNVTLAKGERAAYQVFSGRVSYEHLYEWEVADTPPITTYRPAPVPRDTTGQVWHIIRLSNSLKLPWTTAPALVLSKQQPLAQEILDYTPAGAVTNLRLTVATDIRTQQQEQEVKRENNAVTINRTTYSVVTIEGKLTLKNYKSKDVQMVVRRQVEGEVLTTTPNAKVERTTEAVQTVNPTSRLVWELPVKAGEEVTLTYRYKVLVN